MNKYLIILVFLLSTLLSYTQVGIQTNTPDASSALDITATNRGLLIPRVILTSTLSNPSPVTSPATGLMVFNSGANQPQGFYYWTGSAWSALGSGSGGGDYWSLTGNAGTTVGTDFIGTTDAEDLAFYTNNNERMRIEQDGQVVIGLTTPYYSSDFVTIEGNATQNYALNVFSPYVGLYIEAPYGVYSIAGTRAILGRVNNSSGSGGYFENQSSTGWGALFMGSGQAGATLSGHSAGLSSSGNDGIFAYGRNAGGTGIIAGGNATTSFSYISAGTGGAFTGYHGVYGKATNSSSGNGVIGVGNNGSTYATISEGSGGAFTGYHGTYGKATSYSSGIGVIGLGNNGSTYATTGNGSGGAFTGYHGLLSKGTNSTLGTGVIGIGNDGSYFLYSYGSGGAFTGNYCGVAGWATTNSNSSVGVYGYYDGAGAWNDGRGVVGIAVANWGRGYGVYGEGNRYGVYANGNLGASGTKSFAIDHPDDPENKILKHYSIESNEVLNMYRGNVLLDDNGESTIVLPDYFMTINIDFSYTLTPIGKPSPNLFVKEEINNNGEFVVSGGQPGQKISWVVYADRNDPYMQKNRESEVDVIEKGENDRGKYITPELYGQPKEKGVFYIENNSMKKAHQKTSVTTQEVSVKAELVTEKDEFDKKK